MRRFLLLVSLATLALILGANYSKVTAQTLQSKVWPTGQVLDQGQYPYCVGYAFEALLDAEPMSYIGHTHPSPLAIYVGAQYYDEWDGWYEGTSLEGAAAWLSMMDELGPTQWTTSTAITRDYILARGPVVVGSDWLWSMEVLDKDGFVATNHPVSMGSHAYLCYGYDVEGEYFLCQNSWGTGWGTKGRFKITFESMANLIEDPARQSTVALTTKNIFEWERALQFR